MASRIGPDYDPDAGDVLYDDQRNPIDAAEIERLADEAEAGYRPEQGTVNYPRRGRPSLSGRAAASPQLRLRVPAELRDRAQQRADAEGKSLSQLAREALERHLAS